MTAPLNRRRLLCIGAAFAAGPALGRAARATEARWQGHALGAHASIRLSHLNDAEAAPVFAAVEAELRRLERIFSLYDAESALSRLNRDGALAAPPAELLELLSLARTVHAETDGLFDPTVQPLFRLYAKAGGVADAAALDAALATVGFGHLGVSTERIAFDRPGMALTLNGIAQGHITDRIAALLRAEGFGNVLVDIGEIAALGAGPTGEGWRIGLSPAAGESAAPVLRLADRAIATSAPLGTVLDAAGRIGHILHPRHGAVPAPRRRATVLHDSAAVADALSTAAALMSEARIEALRRSGIEVLTA